MAFFIFNQNNSGGHFHQNERVDCYVIVEAKDATQANDRAESIGIYFNGVRADRDCECCGDRWYPAYGDGFALPGVWESGDAVDHSNVKVHYEKDFAA